MDVIITGLIAIVFYLGSTILQSLYLTGKYPQRRMFVLIFSIVAILAHAYSIYGVLFTSKGINLSLINMSSLIGWIIGMIAVISSLRQPLESLFVILFPCIIITIALSLFIESSYQSDTNIGLGLLSHILLSLTAYSLLVIAAMQALLVVWQDNRLKTKHTKLVLHVFPPLQTMENLLFNLLIIGLVLLTASIITGILFLDDIFAQHLVHKTILSIVAWFIFLVLTWGHYKIGWRGTTVIRWLIIGCACLILAYLGSKFVLEILLHQN